MYYFDVGVFMKRELLESTENNNYKSKLLKRAYSILANKKQGIVVYKRR